MSDQPKHQPQEEPTKRPRTKTGAKKANENKLRTDPVSVVRQKLGWGKLRAQAAVERCGNSSAINSDLKPDALLQLLGTKE